ncbi:MAG TPA: hypothetical protein PK867_30295, partial [Pirellulales bacterium]|nr:hypothetical protein [Pirellulales bacterium]
WADRTPGKEGVPAACIEQWTKDTVRSMESERTLVILLTLSTCLLYASRLRGRFSEQAVKATDKPAA